VIDLDYNSLTMGVEKRLDEIFADELKGHNPQMPEFKYFETPSMANLKSTIMSLEWEVTDDNLNDFIDEIRRLQKAFAKDDQLKKLFRLLFHLGQYIKIHKSHTHPFIFKLLFRVYNSSAKIASKKCSNYEKAKIVNDEIKRYHSLKAYLVSKNKAAFQRSLKKANTLEKNLLSSIDSINKQKQYTPKYADKIYYRNLNNDLRELKKFIYLEIKRLRSDLQRLMAIISKKSIN
jgi:hypothetical protein